MEAARERAETAEARGVLSPPFDAVKWRVPQRKVRDDRDPILSAMADSVRRAPSAVSRPTLSRRLLLSAAHTRPRTSHLAPTTALWLRRDLSVASSAASTRSLLF